MEIISFFSFKGGVGRTALLTNLGAWWASHGKVVLLIDMDLAAPGLTYSPWAKKEAINPLGQGLGMSDVMDVFYRDYKEAAENISYLPVTALMCDMINCSEGAGGAWSRGGRLMIVGAGSEQFATSGGMAGMPEAIPSLTTKRPTCDSKASPPHKLTALRTLAYQIREDLEGWTTTDGRSIDYVLVDTRTGLPELVGFGLGLLADRMVLVSGLNGQNLHGLEHTLKSLIEHERIPLDQFPAYVSLVFSPIPGSEDKSTHDAITGARQKVSSVLRRLENNSIESSPTIYHIHYTPILAYNDNPIILKYPDSLYSQEIKSIAGEIDGTRFCSNKIEIEVDKPTQIAVESLLKSISPSKKSRNNKIFEQKNRENPAACLPSWSWALPNDQQEEDYVSNFFKDNNRIEIDKKDFLNKLSWSVRASIDKKNLIDRLQDITQYEINEKIHSFERSIQDLIKQASIDPGNVLATLYQIQKNWAELINNSNNNNTIGLRHFLYSPVEGKTLFKNWELWPEYWIFLARDLLTTFNDIGRAVIAIDRAKGAIDNTKLGNSEQLALEICDLMRTIKIPPQIRETLRKKALELAPDNIWVEFSLLQSRSDNVGPELVYKKVLPLLDKEPKHESLNSLLGEFICENPPDPGYGVDFFSKVNEFFFKAETFLVKATETASEPALVWNALGLLRQKRLHRYEDAETAYRRAIELDPTCAVAWNSLGTLLTEHLHGHTEAEAVYRKAIHLDTHYAAPWNGLGNLLARHFNRDDEAEAAYHNAIELDSKEAAPWNGLVLLFCDRLKSSIEDLSNIFDNEFPLASGMPIEPYMAMNHGLWMARLGQRDLARQKIATARNLFYEKQLHQWSLWTRLLLLDFKSPLSNDRESLDRALEGVRALASARPSDFEPAFMLQLHALVEPNKASQPKEAAPLPATHDQRFRAIQCLYDLAGWRPDCRIQARIMMQGLFNCPNEHLARLKGEPKPELCWRPYQPFLRGESVGAGDPRDLSLWSQK